MSCHAERSIRGDEHPLAPSSRAVASEMSGPAWYIWGTGHAGPGRLRCLGHSSERPSGRMRRQCLGGLRRPGERLLDRVELGLAVDRELMRPIQAGSGKELNLVAIDPRVHPVARPV